MPDPTDKVIVLLRSQYATAQLFADAVSALYDGAKKNKPTVFLFSINGEEFYFAVGYAS